MKNLSMLTWLTQLGLSIALPPAGFVLLAVWLRGHFHLGIWVIYLAVALGLVCALNGFITSLKTMSRLAEEDSEKDPPAVFNDHD